MSKISVIERPSLRNIPAQLRQLAEAIEHGDRGHVHGCAFVLDADPVCVFYWGDGEGGPNAHLLLHVGAAKIVSGVLEVMG